MPIELENLEKALDRINILSGRKCFGISDRRRLLEQIEQVANTALDGLVLSGDEKETIFGLRNGTCKVVL